MSPLDIDDLEWWATAAYLLGRTESAQQALSRGFQLGVESGDEERAVRLGFWLVFVHFERDEVAQASGWIARIGRLLEELPPESVAHGYGLVLEAHQEVASDGRYDEGRATAQKAAEIAREGEDHDLEALALHVRGRALLRLGEVGEGLRALDEAMVHVTSDQLSPVVVGTVYCSLIEACEEIAELRRSHQWTQSLSAWCDRQQGEVPFTAQCLIHRSQVLRRSGELKRAEEEATAAYERFLRTPYGSATGRALYQLGEIKRLRGLLDEAEEAFREASEWGFDPQPGLALLRLAQGDSSTAAASLGRRLSETEEPVERMRLLPPFVAVMLAANEPRRAESAVAELREGVSVYGTDALAAHAAYAEGALALADDDAQRALVKAREASTAWQKLNMPYEMARARVLLARACRRLGDEETASLELNAARRQFDDLGVSDPSQVVVEEPDHGLTPRELEVLQLLATGVTNQEIADELYLSVRTVDRHVANILAKLGVPTRTAAASRGHELGVV